METAGREARADRRGRDVCFAAPNMARRMPEMGRQRYDRPGCLRAVRGQERSSVNCGFGAIQVCCLYVDARLAYARDAPVHLDTPLFQPAGSQVAVLCGLRAT